MPWALVCSKGLPMSHYLDHNATTHIRRQVIERMAEVMGQVGNASALHRYGRQAKALVEAAREQVGALVGAPRPQDVIFTASGSEANNMAAHAAPELCYRPSAVEHAAALQARADAQPLPVDASGQIAVAGMELKQALVACQLANNETGILQDLSGLAEQVGYLHVDAVQAAGKIAVDMPSLGADSLALSAHKFGGPQGVGALVIRPGLDMPAFILGGGQERRRRAGTENVAGIVGFGLAAELALRDLEAYAKHTETLREAFEAGLPETVEVVGRDQARLPNTSCVLVPGKSASILLMKADLAGLALSSGSACSSGKVTQSHVLSAMGIAPEMAATALRISFGRRSTTADVEAALAFLRSVLAG